jgi:cell division protein FtsQ
VEIRRRKFTARSWAFYGRVFLIFILGVAGATALFLAGRFLMFSPSVALLSAEQIEIAGAHNVNREVVLSRFADDQGRSILRVPLEERRVALEELPWVEQASVQRVLPNHIRVEITERVPVAFLRNGPELALIDAHGVILDRPEGQEFQFAIVSGVAETMPPAERERRMQTFQEFLKDVELVKSGSSERVSEVDLSNPKDLVAVMTGLAGPGSDAQAVTLHFGQTDFVSKYRMLVENFAAWQADAGRIVSIDLQYTRQVVVNPESGSSPAALGATKGKSR